MYPFHSGRAESTLNNKLRRLRVSLPGMGSKSSLLAADYVYVEYLLGFGVGGSRSSSADSIWTLPIVLRVFLDRSSRKGFIMSVRFCWRDWIKIIYGRSVTYISTGIWILTLKFYFPCAKMTLSSKWSICWKSVWKILFNIFFYRDSSKIIFFIFFFLLIYVKDSLKRLLNWFKDTCLKK